jgi:hypothetical protein
MVYIYVLKLEQGKYYIGKTSSPKFRLETHFKSYGSAWTNKYKPIKVIELIPNCDDYDEDKYTKIYMDKYGIDSVRGGSFVQIKLNESTQEHLHKMSNGTNDKCFKCGKKGHFEKNCKIVKDEDEEAYCCNYCNKEFDTKKGCLFHENVYCKKNRRKKTKKYKYYDDWGKDDDNYNFSDDEF